MILPGLVRRRPVVAASGVVFSGEFTIGNDGSGDPWHGYATSALVGTAFGAFTPSITIPGATFVAIASYAAWTRSRIDFDSDVSAFLTGKKLYVAGVGSWVLTFGPMTWQVTWDMPTSGTYSFEIKP